jgi:hypothetical protein
MGVAICRNDERIACLQKAVKILRNVRRFADEVAAASGRNDV